MTEPNDVPPETPAAPGAGSGGDAGGEPRTYTEAELRERIAAQEAEFQDRILRLAAEYQNYRRRVEREKEQLGDEVLERFARDLLPALDSFERALSAAKTDAAAAVSGIELVDRQLRAALEKHGMTVIDPAGGAFDPRFHEAMFRTPTRDREPGTVLAVLEKGWQMRTRLLRAARVQVAAAPEKG